MGTTAEKLTYLNETKGLLKNNINLTGAGLTNQTPFRQYATDLKTALLNILNNGIDTLYNNFPQTTGTGTNITLNNTLEAPIKSELLGNTSQDGTPTPDSPVEIEVGTGRQDIKEVGRNLFNDYRTTSRTLAGVTYSGVDGGTKLNGTYDQTVSADFWLTESMKNSYNNLILLKANTTYTIKVSVVSGTFETNYGFSCALSSRTADENKTFSYNYQILTQDGTTWEKTFTVGDSDIYGAGVRFTLGTNRITTFNNTVFHVQIEKGSTATEYEAYKEQSYEINLGKNLFDVSNVAQTTHRYGITYKVENDVFTLSGTNTSSSAYSLVSWNDTTTQNYFSNIFQKGKTYTLSSNNNISGLYLQINYYAEGSSSQSRLCKLENFGTGITFTVPQDFEKIGIIFLGVNGNATTIDGSFSFQLEKGNQATSYAPYFTPIELCKIGDYQDRIYKDNGKWYLYKAIGKYTFTGNENWNVQATDNNFTTFQRPDILPSTAKATNYQQGLCKSNYFKTAITWNIWTNTDVGIDAYVKRILITIPSSIATTKTQLNQWLQEHNVYLDYVLETPTTEEITSSNYPTLYSQLNSLLSAKSYDGTTNITITAETPADIKITALKNE